MTENVESQSSSGRDTKMDRVMAKYGIEGIAVELEKLWTRDEDQLSVRDLADYFNETVLREALRDAGMDTFQTEVETMYRVIKDDEGDVGEMIEIEERLAEANVDVDALTSDFVSHQTVYNYLTGTREVEYERNIDPEDRLRRSNESVQKMKNRLTAVAENNVSSLERVGLVTMGEFDVVSEVHVYCQDCGGRFTIAELVDDRGCDCERG